MKSNWKQTKVGDLVEQVNNSISIIPTETYTLLGMSLEGRGLFIRENKKGSEIGSKSLNKLESGYFIYSRLFAWKGAFDFVRDEFEGLFVSDEYPTFRVDDKKIDVKFLYYYFNQAKTWKAVEQYCIGVTKASRNRFKEEFFLEFQIPLPPLSEQKRIIAKIESIKGKIEAIRKLREEQEREMKNFIYSYFKNLIDEYGTLPLGKVISYKKKFVEIDDNTIYKLCRVQTKAQGVILRETKFGYEIKTKQQQVCKTGDFIVAEMDARLGGYGIIDKELDNAIVSSHYFLYDINDNELNRKYLDFYIKTHWFHSQIEAKGSTNYASIRPQQVLLYEIPLPPIEEQNRIVALLDKANSILQIHKEQEKELNELLPSLLDKAFKGEL